MTNRIVYMGTADAIDAEQLQGFTSRDIDEMLAALSDHPHLAAKVRRARNWAAGAQET